MREAVKDSKYFIKKSRRYFFKKYRVLYFFMLPGVVFFLIFKIAPLYGMLVAFQDFYTHLPWGTFWVGLKWFKILFKGDQFFKLLGNTLGINALKLLFGFPLPILLAIIFHELRGKIYKRTVQTITYFPQFLSWVIVYGLMFNLLNSTSGVLNVLLERVAGKSVPFLADYRWFPWVIVATSVWKNIGWGSIIFVAALGNVSPELYESADMDGANYFQKLIHITLPCISVIIAMNFVMQIGNILFGDFEQMLMFMGTNYVLQQRAEIFETFVYRMATTGSGQFGLGGVVSIIQSVFGVTMVVLANFLVKKIGGRGIW